MSNPYTPPPAEDFPPGLSRRARLWLELLRELETVHAEQVPLEFMGDADDDRYSGDLTWKTARGWQIVVFIDCGDWDYINDAITPDGLSLIKEATNDDDGYLDGAFAGTIYAPTREEQWTVWGIVG